MRFLNILSKNCNSSNLTFNSLYEIRVESENDLLILDVNFQFSLWDSSFTRRSIALRLSSFNSLYEIHPSFGRHVKSPHHTFNSLYEIQPSAATLKDILVVLSILFMRFKPLPECNDPNYIIFQFSLWDSLGWIYNVFLHALILSILFMRFLT